MKALLKEGSFLKKLWHRMFPTGFLPEFKCIFHLAWPITLMNLFRFINPTASVILCGHLSKEEFGAASLANGIINVFGVSVDLGFSTACDTLFSQIYGSRHKRRLGLMLQRATLVMTTLFFFLSCFHLNIEPLLILLQQDVEITRLTARYVALYLPGLFFDFQFLTLSRYLQNQNIVYPMMISSFIGAVFNAVSQYIALYVIGYGIDSSAILQACGCFVMFICQLTYVLVTKVYKPTWQGFDFYGAIQEWGIFFKFGIPGIVMLGVEEWAFEIGNFLSGSLSEIQLGAQSVGFQIEIFTYMIHLSLAVAVAIRAGQHLGGNRPQHAATAARVELVTDLLISIFNSTVLFSFKKYLPYIFTSEKEIVELAEKILTIVAVLQYLDAGCSSASGIFRACGRQFSGALIMFISYYVIGVPIGLVFVLVVGMDITGFWYGLMIALVLEVFVYMLVIYHIDWDLEASKAQERISQTQTPHVILEEGSDREALLDKSIEDHISPLPERRPIIVGIPSRRSMSGSIDIFKSWTMDDIKTGDYDECRRRIILKRLLLCGMALTLFIISIVIKFRLPRGLYIPCIPVNSNQTSLPLNKHYPFCNDTMYNF